MSNPSSKYYRSQSDSDAAATQKRVQSPCVANCCLDENDTCLGCFRTIDEITGWYEASDELRLEIKERCEQRKALKRGS